MSPLQQWTGDFFSIVLVTMTYEKLQIFRKPEKSQKSLLSILALWHCHKMVKVNPGSSFKEIGSTRVPDAVYQVSTSSASGSEEDFIFWTYIWVWSYTWNIWIAFHSPHPVGALYEIFCFNQPSGFWSKEVWKYWIWVALGKGQWTTMTLGSHKLSCTHLFDYKYRLLPHRIHQFLGNLQF